MSERTDNCICLQAGRQAEGYFKFKYQFKCKLVFESRKEPSEFGGRGWKAGTNQGRFRKESQILTSKMLTNSLFRNLYSPPIRDSEYFSRKTEYLFKPQFEIRTVFIWAGKIQLFRNGLSAKYNIPVK